MQRCAALRRVCHKGTLSPTATIFAGLLGCWAKRGDAATAYLAARCVCEGSALLWRGRDQSADRPLALQLRGTIPSHASSARAPSGVTPTLNRRRRKSPSGAALQATAHTAQPLPRREASKAASMAASGWFVGCSGWSYDCWRGSFFPPGLPQAQELPFISRLVRPRLGLRRARLAAGCMHAPTHPLACCCRSTTRWRSTAPSTRRSAPAASSAGTTAPPRALCLQSRGRSTSRT